jgi:LysM repeat protein
VQGNDEAANVKSITIGTHELKIAILVLLLVVITLAGCARRGPDTVAEGEARPGYAGALDLSYPGALDAIGQLALGTLKLEGTTAAVTADQATRLLPLWRALQGSALQGDAERNAVTKQIERTMTGDQVSAIIAMRLTQEDAQAWAQSQGGRGLFGGGQRPGAEQRPGGALPPDMSEGQIAQMREQSQNMSPEERATRRAQFGGQGAPGGRASPPAAGSSQGLIGSVIGLLAERGDIPAAPAAAQVRKQRPSPTPMPRVLQETARQATPAPTPTSTPTAEQAAGPTSTPNPTATPSPTSEPVVHVVQPGDSLAAIARRYGVPLEAVIEANAIQDPNLIRAGQRLVIPSATQISGPMGTPAAGNEGASSPSSTFASPWSLPGLKWLPDRDPGPPFTIEVSANRAKQDPLVEKSQIYQITGIVRNDGDQTYAVSAIHVTFFDAEGFRGSFRKFPQPWETGGEWIWQGRTEADIASLLLAPGEEWPFSVAIRAQDMALFLIHPDAVPTGRESASVELSGVQVVDGGANHVRITGTATNGNPFVIKNVTVSGVLLDASGQILSIGSKYVLQEEIAPGASVRFDVRIEKEPYAQYRLYAQAERD